MYIYIYTHTYTFIYIYLYIYIYIYVYIYIYTPLYVMFVDLQYPKLTSSFEFSLRLFGLKGLTTRPSPWVSVLHIFTAVPASPTK